MQKQTKEIVVISNNTGREVISIEVSHEANPFEVAYKALQNKFKINRLTAMMNYSVETH